MSRVSVILHTSHLRIERARQGCNQELSIKSKVQQSSDVDSYDERRCGVVIDETIHSLDLSAVALELNSIRIDYETPWSPQWLSLAH
jgi:hypothetical protein